MPKKVFVAPTIAPLQRVKGEEITDPAERAAIDKMRLRLQRNRRRLEAMINRNGTRRSKKTKVK